ncbi:MAG: hypothetical protein ACTSYB_14200 [Candidatus Helarchaeota archaeon]
MGVKLTPIIIPDVVDLSALAGKKVVVDGCNLLFKYITKIRKDGKILYNAQGDPVSHLLGFFYFTINLLERRIRPIYVFDGYPPREKRQKSPIKIQRLVRMWRLYQQREGDRSTFYKDPLFLYDKIVADLQELVRLMGCPVVRGLSEGEAQGARLVREGKAHALISSDQDSLLFGCPLTYYQLLFDANLGKFYDLQYQLTHLGLSRRQLIDVAILIGTDYNPGAKGIGPKKALKLIRQYGQLEDIPTLEFPFDIDRVRQLFLKPATITAAPLYRAPNTKYLTYFLKQKGWQSRRIERGISRLRRAFRQLRQKQATILSYIEE